MCWFSQSGFWHFSSFELHLIYFLPLFDQTSTTIGCIWNFQSPPPHQITFVTYRKLYERWRATVGVAYAKAEVSHREKITVPLVTKSCLELLPKSFCVELRWESARLHFVTAHVGLQSITMRASTRGGGGVCTFHHPEDSCFIPSIAALTVAGRRLGGRHNHRNLSHSSHSGFI